MAMDESNDISDTAPVEVFVRAINDNFGSDRFENLKNRGYMNNIEWRKIGEYIHIWSSGDECSEPARVEAGSVRHKRRIRCYCYTVSEMAFKRKGSVMFLDTDK
ncbi:hypothetical protein RF11_12145 [Thelohanellus kitauei]|uniref:Uncharacterized protein n=1 Tax=Thelohanellus kitauei TaxID=669202 RepID=A0A0C2M7G2_THEKT|nr:hypothetical protein RF11_12145 [Thelohanellus kitauei]